MITAEVTWSLGEELEPKFKSENIQCINGISRPVVKV